MTSEFTSLLTSSHLDIKVPLSPISASAISTILATNSRRTLFFDESVSLFIIFKLPIEAADDPTLTAFLKAIELTLEVAITDTPRQSDLSVKKEKFEGTLVHTATVPETTDKIKEQIEGHWFVAWNVTVPIKHGRSKTSNPRVALTAILALAPKSLENEPKEEYITAYSWDFLAGQENLLAPLVGDPELPSKPVLPLSRIVSSAPSQSPKTKPGRRICRHIFPCGSPLDVRMRYNPLELDDQSVATETVILSVDLSVTPHANASVLLKDIKVEMGGGIVTPLQEIRQSILHRYDVWTLLYRYERYGNEARRKAISTSVVMVPLLTDSEETSPTITSTWEKVLDISNLLPLAPQFTAPSVANQAVSPPANATRHSTRPSIASKPRTIPTAHIRAQIVPNPPFRTTEPPHLSILIRVPPEGVNPNEEFAVDIQIVNRAIRPVKLALQVDSGQAQFRTKSKGPGRTDKVLPRVPMSSSPITTTHPARKGLMTDAEARALFVQEMEIQKPKPIIALTVEGKIGTLLPGQVQAIQAQFLALMPGIHEIKGLCVVEIPTSDTPPNGGLNINLTSCPSIVVHGGRY